VAIAAVTINSNSSTILWDIPGLCTDRGCRAAGATLTEEILCQVSTLKPGLQWHFFNTAFDQRIHRQSIAIFHFYYLRPCVFKNGEFPSNHFLQPSLNLRIWELSFRRRDIVKLNNGIRPLTATSKCAFCLKTDNPDMYKGFTRCSCRSHVMWNHSVGPLRS
jgi:hypothetical protein